MASIVIDPVSSVVYNQGSSQLATSYTRLGSTPGAILTGIASYTSKAIQLTALVSQKVYTQTALTMPVVPKSISAKLHFDFGFTRVLPSRSIAINPFISAGSYTQQAYNTTIKPYILGFTLHGPFVSLPKNNPGVLQLNPYVTTRQDKAIATTPNGLASAKVQLSNAKVYDSSPTQVKLYNLGTISYQDSTIYTWG